MRRDTTDSMNRGTDQADLTTGNACWETPPLIFEKLNRDFGPFDVDLTADGQRHLCPVWFGPDSEQYADALAAVWPAWGSSGYSNPPYGPFVQRLLAKAKIEATRGFGSTLLLPMRVTAAFKAHVLRGAAELWYCDSRITFFEHGAPRINVKAWRTGRLVADPAMFDSILVRYVPGTRVDARPLVDIWKVPAHITKADLDRAHTVMASTHAVPVED